MNSKTRPILETRDSAWKVAYQLGFWSAVLTAVLAAVFATVSIATPPRSGLFCSSSCVTYPYTSVVSFIPGDYLWLIPGFLLALIFLILMVCIHSYAPNDRKIFSQIGLSFSIAYAALITTDYFIQFTVVIPSLLKGEAAGLSLLTQYNPHGIFIALEGLGYLMMSAALLSTAPVFFGGRLERAIQGLFIASFVLAVGFLIGLSWLKYDIVAFEVAILTINWVVLIISGVLLSILFKRAERLVPS